MSHSVICYASPKKPRTRLVLKAFASGCPGARVVHGLRDLGGPSALYGVHPDQAKLWRSISRRRFYYIDRGYFARETHYRISIAALQCQGRGKPDHDRFRRLGVAIEPWRPEGRHILVCPQSDWWHRLHCGVSAAEWTNSIAASLRVFTDRTIKVRAPTLMKNGQDARDDFRAALDGVHCVVVWNSACAIEAVCAGVPAIVLGPSAFGPVTGDRLGQIEDPPRPDGREEWAAVLAANQWTLPEMSAGVAWRTLRGMG